MSNVAHINPEGLVKSPAYTQAIRIPAGHDLVIVGGQNGVDESGQVVGDGLASQTSRALANIGTCLEAAGAGWEHVVRLGILVRKGASLGEGFAAFQDVFGDLAGPPTVTVSIVDGLAVPGAECEIEALAAVPA